MISSDVIVEPAPAKLNLALHVRARRPDGYHDLETLFVFCRDGDVVTIADAQDDSFTITGPFASALAAAATDAVPADRAGWADNLVTRAADGFRDTFGVAQRHAIILEKNLPVASGIGGGSADAAATLRALARRHGVSADDPRLIAIAARLGADVPACLAGRTAFGTGKGDALAPLDGWAGAPVLLVNPGVAVSTAAVFAAWDGIDRGPLDPANPIGGRNDLERAARSLAPEIDRVIAVLAAQPGVILARMSGSGATCLALFETVAQRDQAAAAVAAAEPGWWQMASGLA
ncbi:4-(cytidine 5'-diphospho)-2-C-methyl-D-erythritol kinase [Sphingomonas sp.]|jgi:4-diphosphocytidyl-2-C-methyl-D-erythritol kinase|uniref:4-(cytidine 5'-diphospho)-2-C-methyl-D-erythritol kinase n=1 Tax=Sphingomonas sp. TaxID=28214 RepID=UPI0026054644|nr:4-(cytidine 5'-diphospho)-2-C-methyl-D-erythritol kinase [Sphingomonas sp.]MDF2604316.1 4-diphosphocytidyl-2C-methyl-D-erythritol kinase [Sphingomonas sp.]